MDKVKGILSEGDYAELSKDLSAECDRLERSAAEGRKKVEELEAQAETDGELNAKYPGGAEAQRARLEAEGHTVIRRGRTNIRYYVQDYEDALFELE